MRRMECGEDGGGGRVGDRYFVASLCTGYTWPWQQAIKYTSVLQIYTFTYVTRKYMYILYSIDICTVYIYKHIHK
jgi:hypothetical protein